MKTPRALPLLLDIHQPCPVEWDSMAGGEQSRFCTNCQKHVFNLSVLTPAQAAQVITQGYCVSLEYRADGSVITRDTASPRRRTRSAAVTVALAATLAASVACEPRTAEPRDKRDNPSETPRPSRTPSTVPTTSPTDSSADVRPVEPPELVPPPLTAALPPAASSTAHDVSAAARVPHGFKSTEPCNVLAESNRANTSCATGSRQPQTTQPARAAGNPRLKPTFPPDMSQRLNGLVMLKR